LYGYGETDIITKTLHCNVAARKAIPMSRLLKFSSQMRQNNESVQFYKTILLAFSLFENCGNIFREKLIYELHGIWKFDFEIC
jgi:hypothetical protein